MEKDDTDIEVIVSPADGKWETAEKIIGKIYESPECHSPVFGYQTLRKIRIRVENVHTE